MKYKITLTQITKFTKHLCLGILFYVISFSSDAQLEVSSNKTAATLAGALVGSGVIILSPTLTCYPNANGTFYTDSVSPLGIANGIVLSTGSVADSIPFPEDTLWGVANPSTKFANSNWGLPGDEDLTTLGGITTNDACVLEFNLVPAGDTIKFNYVFGSEEYEDYACTGFNDVFGFFITGGAYTTATDLALVPSTSIPVCINSVNCGATGSGSLSTCTALGTGSPFCAYYINNLVTTSIAYPYVVYAGLTKVMQAIAAVNPCDTYHLKLAIADGGDDAYDSGVFIEGGSLTSTAISISPVGINPADTSFGAQYCVRGCTDGKFIFRAKGTYADSTVIHFVVAGNAINGYDYQYIPDSVVIPIHDSVQTVTIHGLAVPTTGSRSIELYIYASYSCSGLPVIADSAEMTIYDSLYVHIKTSDTAVCYGDDVAIRAEGSPSLEYLWTPAATLSSDSILSPTATPDTTTTYTIQASDPGTGCPPSTARITITVAHPAQINVGPPVQSICKGAPLQLNVAIAPSSFLYNYSWTPAAYLNHSNIYNPIVTPEVVGNSEYKVSVGIVGVVDCIATDSFELHVLPNDFDLVSPDTNICFSYGPFQVIAYGDSEFSYQWTPVVGVSNPTILLPAISPPGDGANKYVITASYPGCPDMVHSITYNIQSPNVNIITADSSFCLGTTIPIAVDITPAGESYTFAWSPTDGLTDSNITEPNFFVTTLGTHTYHLTIKSSLGCTSEDSITFTPAPSVDISVSPISSTIDYGSSLQLEATNLLPANSLIYYWYPDNGTLDNTNINDPVASPLATTTYTVVAMNSYGCTDTLSDSIFVDRDISACLPSAFTPNHDGLNDVFRICNNQYQKLVEFSVFNRWGQKVYENNTDINAGWDGTYNGTPQDNGVYNYVIIVAKPDGTNKTYSGSVTLLR